VKKLIKGWSEIGTDCSGQQPKYDKFAIGVNELNDREPNCENPDGIG
jgi:hypothetical protein